ncbi:SusC/RagA family TonB-linked outer membrane protein [Niabella ginsengisoli]|uniref:SusC/RagA family TonB-linked outer membrane protein n=1 Tax=Niabella ginsengisoli TaxID=522298 RepID=A0ABS9SKZ6_9BACT|nr:SusC/RagA family TonB-linked outer membrane protein [Niabella ginsengisoli]MCH5599012.1 SusC/RagA family TonB-linked outer membrane protein [Niabella ginsengisoli]
MEWAIQRRYLSRHRKKPVTEYSKNPNGTWTPNSYSVAYLYDGGRGKNTSNDNLTSFDAQLSFLNNKLRGFVSYTFRNITGNNQDNYIPIFYQTADETRTIQDGRSGIGVGSNQTIQKVLNAYMEYEQTLAAKHYLKVMAGIGSERYHTESNSIFRNDLINTGTPTLQLALDPNSSFTSDGGEYALNSAYSRINYTYDNKYLLELNARMDATSRFPVNDRVGYFPSVSAGWRISEEGFFSGLKSVINDAKFRFSYGSLGNQDVSYYEYIASLRSEGKIGNIIGGTHPPAVYAPGLVSSSLTWEKQNSKNLGIDLALLKNRLSTSFDYYIRDIKDMLTVPQQLPAVLGTAPPLTNAADLRTKGWEMTLTWNDKFNVAGSPLSYNFRFVLSDNQTTITKFNNPNGLIKDWYVGKKVGEIWGMIGDGFFTSDEDVANHADQSELDGYYGFQAGDPKYVDLNGDGKINIGKQTLTDHGDLTIIGNNTPRYTFGFNTSVAWKGFDVSIFLQGVGKRDYWPGDRTGYFWGQYFAPWEQVYKHVIDNVWTPENPDAYFPRFAGWRVGDFGLDAWRDMGVVQTRYLQNGAYMRIKNLTLGYNLPAEIINKLGLKQVRLYLSGENIGEINKTKFKVLDPEALTSSSWGTGKAYPFQRTYSAGLNITF